MGKHINTKVPCFGCGKKFMTSKLKNDGEIYDCSHCNHNHQAIENEVDGGWIHSDPSEVNNET